jgi:hypothetical protein
LPELRDGYLKTHGKGMLEHRVLCGIRRHIRQFVQLLGEPIPIRKLSLADFRSDVGTRTKVYGVPED